MHELPALSYAFDALEPHIDARTMEIHHGKHHAAYVANVNKALEAVGGDAASMDIAALVTQLEKIPEAQRTAVRNNGGGHFNHSLFWELMKPGGASGPSGNLASAINQAFGSLDQMKSDFATAAATRFGSGWAWLNLTASGLKISSTPNQDNPLMDASGTPILGLDVWEHAYYLNYQNRRPDYVSAWWNVVNWDEVNRRFTAAS